MARGGGRLTIAMILGSSKIAMTVNTKKTHRKEGDNLRIHSRPC